MAKVQEDTLKEFINMHGTEKISQMIKAINQFYKLLLESGIIEFHKAELGSAYTKELNKFFFKYETFKFAEVISENEIIEYKKHHIKFPISEEVVNNHMNYFTKRLLHLYNFNKENPFKTKESIFNDKNNISDLIGIKELIQTFYITNLSLFDNSIYDIINKEIDRQLFNLDEYTINQIKFYSILKICGYTISTVENIAKEKQNNGNSKNVSISNIICCNPNLFKIMSKSLDNSDIIKEMILSAKQEYNSVKSTY